LPTITTYLLQRFGKNVRPAAKNAESNYRVVAKRLFASERAVDMPAWWLPYLVDIVAASGSIAAKRHNEGRH
jgi:hypothetical protein